MSNKNRTTGPVTFSDGRPALFSRPRWKDYAAAACLVGAMLFGGAAANSVGWQLTSIIPTGLCVYGFARLA